MRRQKVVLVTGCTDGGLGHCICKAFAASGCLVYASARSTDTMNLTQYGCVELGLDVTETGRIQTVVQEIVNKQGRIDIVVNNAGILSKAWAVEHPLEAVRNLMEVNFFAMWAMNQAVAPFMVRQRSGVIVNIGSATGYCTVPQAAAYSASKFAVRAYSDALRVELAPFNVHVFHVAPGFMKTQLFSKQGHSVYSKEGSPYQQFTHATKLLHQDDLQDDMVGSLCPTDPQRIANRLVKMALSRRPPRHYVDGWFSWMLYGIGCYAPCWLVDIMHVVRFWLPPLCGRAVTDSAACATGGKGQ